MIEFLLPIAVLSAVGYALWHNWRQGEPLARRILEERLAADGLEVVEARLVWRSAWSGGRVHGQFRFRVHLRGAGDGETRVGEATIGHPFEGLLMYGHAHEDPNAVAWEFVEMKPPK